MKNFLQNLLIGFALALCVLVAFQWHREAKLRQQVQTLTDDLQTQRKAAAILAGSVKQAEAEILRLAALKNQFNDLVKTNHAEIARLKGDLKVNAANLEQIDAYKNALEIANASIKKQNESITAQNEETKKLAAERNEVVVKYNQMAEAMANRRRLAS